MKVKDQLEEVCVDQMTLLKYISRKIGCEGVHWIDPAEDTDNWRALVRTEMNFRVP